MPETKETVTLTVPLSINLERVNDLLIGALEGGSNYWFREVIFYRPKSNRQQLYSSKVAERMVADGWLLCVIVDDEGDGDKHAGKSFDVNLSKRDWLAEKIQRFHDVASGHFADWLSENDDAMTADVFLQICCFNEIVYG